MKVLRRDFLKLVSILPFSIPSFFSKLSSTPKPIQLTTYYGKLLFTTVHYQVLPKLSHKEGFDPAHHPPAYRTLWRLNDEYIKSQGMEHLMNYPGMTSSQWVDVRDAEVVNRVLNDTDFFDSIKSRYPKFWFLDGDGAVKMDLFHYLVKELENLEPNNNDLSEEYAQELVKALRKTVPNDRFDKRQEVYHTRESYCLMTQMPIPCITDGISKLYRGDELPIR